MSTVLLFSQFLRRFQCQGYGCFESSILHCYYHFCNSCRTIQRF